MAVPRVTPLILVRSTAREPILVVFALRELTLSSTTLRVRVLLLFLWLAMIAFFIEPEVSVNT